MYLVTAVLDTGSGPHMINLNCARPEGGNIFRVLKQSRRLTQTNETGGNRKVGAHLCPLFHRYKTYGLNSLQERLCAATFTKAKNIWYTDSTSVTMRNNDQNKSKLNQEQNKSATKFKIIGHDKG